VGWDGEEDGDCVVEWGDENFEYGYGISNLNRTRRIGEIDNKKWRLFDINARRGIICRRWRR
jgi:hypothetical protein